MKADGTRKAKVRVNLSPVGKGDDVECDAVVSDGAFDQPEKISITICGLPDDQKTKIRDKSSVSDVITDAKVKGQFLNQPYSFEASLPWVKCIPYSSSSDAVSTLTIELQLGDYVESLDENTTPQRWSFSLVNYQVWNIHSRSDQYSGEEIEFSVSGRTWLLKDDWYHKKNRLNIQEARISGTLSTDYKDGDSADEIKNWGNIIVELLTLALCRDITWTSCRTVDADSTELKKYFRTPMPPMEPYYLGGLPIINDWKKDNLKSFLETAAPNLKAKDDLLWWSQTIGFFFSARINSKWRIVAISLLTSMLNRLVVKNWREDNKRRNAVQGGSVCKTNSSDELDALISQMPLGEQSDINKRISECPGWDRHWTEVLRFEFADALSGNSSLESSKITRCIDDIKECQKKAKEEKWKHYKHLLNYQLAKHQFSLKKQEFVDKRNSVVHEGELPASDQDGDAVEEYYRELEKTVILFVAQTLGFSGEVNLEHGWSFKPQRVKNFLTSQQADQ
ncbi:hypothetical protein [Planctomicrobium sp. SH527]|uniref:hypothetical protein n=1 Tax=Planctomicrobium sp. SH527 TaxID=3448123 RepID=UPI003F5CB1E0